MYKRFVLFVLSGYLISSIAYAQQAPYSGQPIAVPGVFEAEDYDTGGEGVAYHDVVAGNSGAVYRNDDVDITVGPNPGEYRIWNFQTSEWLEYTVQVSQAGSYTAEILASSQFDNSAFHLEIDGVNLSGPVSVANTGGWFIFTWQGLVDLDLDAGNHVVRIVVEQEYFNMDALRFTFVAPPPPPTDSGPPAGDSAAQTDVDPPPTDDSTPPPGDSSSGADAATADSDSDSPPPSSALVRRVDITILDNGMGCSTTTTPSLAWTIAAALRGRITRKSKRITNNASC